MLHPVLNAAIDLRLRTAAPCSPVCPVPSGCAWNPRPQEAQMSQLATQRRMAMSLFGVGHRKVWLDPAKKDVIAKAKTRQAIRDLVGQNIIQVIPSYRGKRDKMTPILQSQNKKLQRMKREWQMKEQRRKQLAGAELTSLSGGSIEEATTEAL